MLWHGRNIKKVDDDKENSRVRYFVEKGIEGGHITPFMTPLHEPWSPKNR